MTTCTLRTPLQSPSNRAKLASKTVRIQFRIRKVAKPQTEGGLKLVRKAAVYIICPYDRKSLVNSFVAKFDFRYAVE